MGPTFNGSLSNCDFCSEFSLDGLSEFNRRYGQELHNRIVLTTETFRVFPSLGQIAEGHVLITPILHYTAVADLPTSMIMELQNICGLVRRTLERVYGQCVFFEHGTRTDECGGCGIYHAHIHAVPIAADSVRETLEQKFDLNAVESLSKLPTVVRSDSSYLFFEDANARAFVTVADYLPSQYMRKLLARSIGKRNWDWREAGTEPELLRAFKILSSHFAVAR